MNIHQLMSALLLVLQSCAFALPSGNRSSDSDKPRQPRSSSKSAQGSKDSSSLLSSESSLLSSTSLRSALVAESAETEQENPVTTQNDVSGSPPVSSGRQSDLHTTSRNAPRRSKNRRTSKNRRRNRKRCRKNRKNSRKNSKNIKKNSRKNKNTKKNKKRHTRRPKGCKGKKSKRKNGKKIKKIRSRRHKTHKGGKTTSVLEVPNLSAMVAEKVASAVPLGTPVKTSASTRTPTPNLSAKVAQMFASAVPLRIPVKPSASTRTPIPNLSAIVAEKVGSAVPLGTPIKPSASTRTPTVHELRDGFRSSVSLSRNPPAGHNPEEEKERIVMETLRKRETKPLQTQQPCRQKLSQENHDSSKESVDVSRSRSSIDDAKLKQLFASSRPLQRRKRGTGFSSLSQKLLRIGSLDNKETVSFIFQIQTALKSEQTELSWLVRRYFTSSRSDGLLDKLLT